MKVDITHAIRYFCAECFGYHISEIKDCTAINCPLFPFRFGKDPYPNKRMEKYKQDPKLWARMRRNQKREDWTGMPENNDNNS